MDSSRVGHRQVHPRFWPQQFKGGVFPGQRQQVEQPVTERCRAGQRPTRSKDALGGNHQQSSFRVLEEPVAAERQLHPRLRIPAGIFPAANKQLGPTGLSSKTAKRWRRPAKIYQLTVLPVKQGSRERHFRAAAKALGHTLGENFIPFAARFRQPLHDPP